MRVVLSLLIFLLFNNVANAQFTVANNTSSKVYCAIGFYQNGRWFSKGWYKIESEESVTILGGALTNRYYYIYAHSDKLFWGGTYNFWIHNSLAFTYDQSVPQGTNQLGFSQIDVNGATNFTLNLTSSEAVSLPITIEK